MLFNIAITDDDAIFENCYKSVCKAFYSEADYNENREICLEHLPNWRAGDLPDDEEKIRQVNQAIDKIIIEVCFESGGMYIMNSSTGERMPFPFVERFHRYFLKNRRWNKPLRDPILHTKELFRLHKPKNSDEQSEVEHFRQNYSEKSADHNHFVNVVAAMARLIRYFMDSKNIAECINIDNLALKDKSDSYAELVRFDKNQGLRIFTLMLSAFLHDIGKTIVYHRHGMEGATIIAEHTSKSWYQIKQIVAEYGFGEAFEREDLFIVADMVEYHDQFGTISTGEAGYQRLIDIIEKIKRYSLKQKNKDDQKKYSERYLFDLWLLNIADIMVSIKDKWKLQKKWRSEEKSREYINKFFEDVEKSKNLTHDLKISRNLLLELNSHRHSDFYSPLTQSAIAYSDRHVVERIRRLVYATIQSVVEKEKKKVEEEEERRKNSIGNEEGEKALGQGLNKDNMPVILKNTLILFDHFDDEYSLSESFLCRTIVRSIQSTRDFKDFCNRFSWIGQMDYCLGFFEKIFARVLNRINYELEPIEEILKTSETSAKAQFCFRSKWIRDKNSDPLSTDNNANTELNRLQCKLIVENFIMTVIMILDLLLFREDSMTRVKNIEFNETRERLTNEKIDTLLSLDGIYKSRRTIHFILRTVFIY